MQYTMIACAQPRGWGCATVNSAGHAADHLPVCRGLPCGHEREARVTTMLWRETCRRPLRVLAMLWITSAGHRGAEVRCARQLQVAHRSSRSAGRLSVRDRRDAGLCQPARVLGVLGAEPGRRLCGVCHAVDSALALLFRARSRRWPTPATRRAKNGPGRLPAESSRPRRKPGAGPTPPPPRSRTICAGW